jgi:hypothetical protein
MVEFRPVRCDDSSRVDFDPGYINRGVIFSGGPSEGWSYNAYDAADTRLAVPEGVWACGCAVKVFKNERLKT